MSRHREPGDQIITQAMAPSEVARFMRGMSRTGVHSARTRKRRGVDSCRIRKGTVRYALAP